MRLGMENFLLLFTAVQNYLGSMVHMNFNLASYKMPACETSVFYISCIIRLLMRIFLVVLKSKFLLMRPFLNHGRFPRQVSFRCGMHSAIIPKKFECRFFQDNDSSTLSDRKESQSLSSIRDLTLDQLACL